MTSARLPTRPLAILHAYSGNLFGGVETLLLTLACHRGMLQHDFALCYEGRLAQLLRGAGARVEFLGNVRFSRPWTVLRARRRLAHLIASRRPDVVICHSAWGVSAFGPVARGKRIPLVLWVHGAYTGRHWLELLARLEAVPDFALCNSKYTLAAIPRVFPKTPAVVVYPPVEPPPSFDPARRAAKREGHGASTDTAVVTLVARLEPWKGHVALLEALASLRDLPGWTAWIVGGAQRRAEDMYRSDLERRTNESRIANRVHFLGQRDDVASLLWASDVYCQPNTAPEPFGIALVEALYSSLPVITTDLGGAREIVTPECGVRIPPGDAQALRNALRLLITDPALRRRLGSAGPSRATSLCAPESAIFRLAEVLNRVARP